MENQILDGFISNPTQMVRHVTQKFGITHKYAYTKLEKMVKTGLLVKTKKKCEVKQRPSGRYVYFTANVYSLP